MPPSAAPIALYYVSLFGALGLYLPYLSRYLTSVGLSEAAAVQVQAVGPIANLVVPPLLGVLADARRARVWLLRGFSLAAAVAFVGLGSAGGHLPAIATMLALFAIVRAPLVPLADATAHEYVRQHGGSYGRLRTWGSLGFFLAALGAGSLYDATSMRTMIAATTAALGLSVVFAWRMPAPAPVREVGLLRDVRALMSRPTLWWFLLAVAAGQSANSSYDSAIALHIARLGHGDDFLGVMIAVGVIAETALIAASGPVIARLGAERALAIAFGAGAVRWLILSQVTAPVLLVLQAPLHALTFGLYWVSATTLMREYAGPRAAAAGQGVLGAATALGSIIGLSGGGALFAAGGGARLYGAAAAAAALATLLATLHAALRRDRHNARPGSSG
jgi:MFS transporter, PPP family, 3-phenylpropionic acid transporter